LGNPNLFGEFYREGVIANPNFCGIDDPALYDHFSVMSIIIAPGDSGSPIFALADNGKLKIIGFCSMAFSEAPQLGIFYKITLFGTNYDGNKQLDHFCLCPLLRGGLYVRKFCYFIYS